MARSLLLKGLPGTGKTTFLLDLANQLEKEIVFGRNYLDILTTEEVFRRSHSRILTRLRTSELGHLPEDAQAVWKAPRERLNRLEESTRAGLSGARFLKQIQENMQHEADDAGINAGIPGTNIDPWGEFEFRSLRAPGLRPVIVDVEPVFPELHRLYDYVDRCLPLPALLVIDSLDGLGEYYGVPMAKLFAAIQRDLVDRGYANVVFVSETIGETPADRFADGILSFAEIESRQGWHGRMRIEKLRGFDVRQREHAYWWVRGHIVTAPSDDEIVEILLGCRRPRNLDGGREILEFLSNPIRVEDPMVID